MSTSGRKAMIVRAFKCLIIAVVCGIFSAVYEHFSHGVYSGYMVYLFAFPLAAGAAAFSVSMIRKAPYPPTAVRNLWYSGISTLAVGSCLRGVFDIYGTTAPLVGIYWIVGCVLTAVSAAIYLIYCAGSGRGKHAA